MGFTSAQSRFGVGLPGTLDEGVSTELPEHGDPAKVREKHFADTARQESRDARA